MASTYSTLKTTIQLGTPTQSTSSLIKIGFDEKRHSALTLSSGPDHFEEFDYCFKVYEQGMEKIASLEDTLKNNDKVIINNKRCKIMRGSVRTADILLISIDLTDRYSISDAERYLNYPREEPVVIFLVGTKKNANDEQIIPDETIIAFAEKHKINGVTKLNNQDDPLLLKETIMAAIPFCIKQCQKRSDEKAIKVAEITVKFAQKATNAKINSAKSENEIITDIYLTDSLLQRNGLVTEWLSRKGNNLANDQWREVREKSLQILLHDVALDEHASGKAAKLREAMSMKLFSEPRGFFSNTKSIGIIRDMLREIQPAADLEKRKLCASGVKASPSGN